MRVVFTPKIHQKAMVDYARAHEWASANAVWSRCAGVVNSPKWSAQGEPGPDAPGVPQWVVEVDIFYSDPLATSWLKGMHLPEGAQWEWRSLPEVISDQSGKE